jgi:hypothetical protein
MRVASFRQTINSPTASIGREASVEKLREIGRRPFQEETDPPRRGSLREQIVSLVGAIENAAGWPGSLSQLTPLRSARRDFFYPTLSRIRITSASPSGERLR